MRHIGHSNLYSGQWMECLHCPPATYLAPRYQLMIIVAWWYICRNVTWLSFFRRMKNTWNRNSDTSHTAPWSVLRTDFPVSIEFGAFMTKDLAIYWSDSNKVSPSDCHSFDDESWEKIRHISHTHSVQEFNDLGEEEPPAYWGHLKNHCIWSVTTNLVSLESRVNTNTKSGSSNVDSRLRGGLKKAARIPDWKWTWCNAQTSHRPAPQ